MNIEEKYNNFYFYYEYFVVFINGTSYNLNKSKKVLKFLNNLDSFSTIGGVSKLNNYEQIRLVQVLDLLSIKWKNDKCIIDKLDNLRISY